MRNEILKMSVVVFAIGLLSVFVLSCGGSSGGGDDGDGDGGGGSQTLTITGESGNQVNLNGTWSSGCDPDIGDGSSKTGVLTVSGSSFSQVENEWFDSTTCSGTSDVTLNISGTVVLGDELTATMGSANVTATEIDVVFTSVTGTVNNSASASDLNIDNACGFNNWVAGTPKSLLGTSCFPDSSSKDNLYIDDVANPDVWYDGDDDGPVDVNGYPTNVDSETSKERV